MTDRYVELSHVITAGMTTYPGLPRPEVVAHLTREASRDVYAAGTEFSIDLVSMVGNTGTYLDSPFHRFADGTDLAGLPLSSLVDLPVVLVRRSGRDDAARGWTSRRSLDSRSPAARYCCAPAVTCAGGQRLTPKMST